MSLRALALDAGSPGITISILLAAIPASADIDLGSGDKNPVFFATDYGVVADSTTNNRVALQSLVDAASGTVEGGTLLFPSGIIRFDSTITMSGTEGLVWQGQGGISSSLVDTRAGTVFLFDPLGSYTEPKAFVITDCAGVGFRDMGVMATDTQSGDVFTFTNPNYCFMENMRIGFNAVEGAGLAVIKIESTTSTLATGNRFYNLFVGAVGSGAAREAYGVELTCQTAAASAAVTDNQFIMCKFANFENPGAAIRMDGLSDCPVGNSKFISCYLAVPADGDRAGIDANNADRSQFLAVTIDNNEAADTSVEFDANCQGNFFHGAADAVISDLQTTPSDKLTVFEAGGALYNFSLPWLLLQDTGAEADPPVLTNGTMWVGARDGAATDTMWVRLNGAWIRAAP